MNYTYGIMTCSFCHKQLYYYINDHNELNEVEICNCPESEVSQIRGVMLQIKVTEEE